MTHETKMLLVDLHHELTLINGYTTTDKPDSGEVIKIDMTELLARIETALANA